MFKLELKNICFTYPTNEKRQNFTLRVEYFSPGKCTAIMGENGSGKTTLGKLAAGLLRPDSGCVLYDGKDIAGLKLGEIGKQVGYLFQEPARQIFAPTPVEEIAFPLELRGVSKEEAHERAWEYLRMFELENIAENTSYTLSRGEKQRLAIAAAMVMEPRFFVLDEPTTGLDKRRRGILSDTLHSLLGRGVAILLISHDRDFSSSLDAEIRYMDGGGFSDS
ncbi:MAG: energy-coupling factor ABC transporter ATP-binding protein [Oscillospiraceae bacterium]|nr:energy-coupling factor ABC transporter ATP-binding protein [Oscillospiraceae bacterium]